MKHPFQLIESDGSYLFVAVRQTLEIFDIKTGNLVNSWTDELDSSYILHKQQQAKILALEQQGGLVKVPKVPTPGKTLPKINNFIRNLLVTDTHVVLTTDTDKLCVIFERVPVEEGLIKFVKRVEFSKRPCSVVIDSKVENVILGDKFGDVYKIPLQGDLPSSEALVPILGHVSMLTNVNNFVKDGKEYVITTDRDEHIKISNYPKLYIIETFLFEHLNFISSSLVTADLKLLTGGGDAFLCYWDLVKYELILKLDLNEIFAGAIGADEGAESGENGKDDRFIVLKIDQFTAKYFVVVLEKSPYVLVIDKDTLQVVQLVQLEANIVDLSTTETQVIAALETGLVNFISVNGDNQFAVDKDEMKFISNSGVEVENAEDIIPLFTVGNLRKYSEKYV